MSKAKKHVKAVKFKPVMYSETWRDKSIHVFIHDITKKQLTAIKQIIKGSK